MANASPLQHSSFAILIAPSQCPFGCELTRYASFQGSLFLGDSFRAD